MCVCVGGGGRGLVLQQIPTNNLSINTVSMETCWLLHAKYSMFHVLCTCIFSSGGLSCIKYPLIISLSTQYGNLLVIAC